MDVKTNLTYNIGKDTQLDESFKALHNYIVNQIVTKFKEKEQELIATLGSNEVDETDENYIKLTMSYEHQQKAVGLLEEAYLYSSKALSHI